MHHLVVLSERMVRLSVLSCLAGATLLSAPPTAAGATVSGIVTDASGKPLDNARIDHTGKRVIVVATDVVLKPSQDEARTDAEGHFQVVTGAPAIVVRTPGYESQRLLVTGDAQVQVTLQPIKSTSRCKLSAPPVFKTRKANDIDYTATWFYIKTNAGPKGIISGSGFSYSLGAPADKDVWTSVEYAEMMYESGMVDAAGRSADGKYWRSRTTFGAAAQYYNQSRETAEQLDCVM
jgi:hypothetical protein